MKTYYIDPEGTDSNDGLSQGYPWAIGALYGAFERGLFKPGDHILFHRGRVHQVTSGHGWIRTRNCSGTKADPIVLSHYGTSDHRPVLDMLTKGQVPMIGMYGGDVCDHLHIEDLEVCNVLDTAALKLAGVTGWRLRNLYVHHGIWEQYIGIAIHVNMNSRDVVIEDCLVEDNKGEGLYCGKTGIEDRTEVIVRRCTFRRCENEAIDFKGGVSNSLIEDCYFEDNAPRDKGDDAQINLGGLDNIMRGCTVKGAAGSNRYGVNFFYTHSCQAARRTLVENCVFIGAGGAGESGAAIGLDGDENTLRDCSFIDCPTSILADSNACVAGGLQRVSGCEFQGGIVPVRFEKPTSDVPLRLFAFDYNTYDRDGIWAVDGRVLSLADVQALGQETHAGTPGTDPDRGRPRIQYRRRYILLPQNAEPAWWHAVVDATHEGRNTIGGSADDAGIGDLDDRNVVVVNPTQWPVLLTQGWFDEHYPGVNVVFVEAATPEELYEKLVTMGEYA